MSWLSRIVGSSAAEWSLQDLSVPIWTSSFLAPTDEGAVYDLESYASRVYKDNGVVFAVVAVRQLLFSEARFLWRRYRAGKPGDLFATADLTLLERPWPGGTTRDLLSRMESDVSLAGNFFATTVDDNGNVGESSAGGSGRRIVRMRPDWVTIVSGETAENANRLDTKPILYRYLPDGSPKSREVLLKPSEVCHYAPIPDPEFRWRGMSWLTPILREVEADKAATVHKGRFFRNGATPNLSVTLDKDIDPGKFEQWMDKFRQAHQGADNAYKTLYLGGGADVKPLSADFKQLDFKLTQGAGETRIAAAGGVPPVIVGLSEGLQAATYSNYGQARRRLADGTMRPLWGNAASSLETLLTSPGPDANLWYDVSDIAFLREDQQDIAKIQNLQASTLKLLVDAGYTPDSSKAAVQAEDFGLLVHSGLYSVQLQEAGTQPPALEA